MQRVASTVWRPSSSWAQYGLSLAGLRYTGWGFYLPAAAAWASAWQGSACSFMQPPATLQHSPAAQTEPAAAWIAEDSRQALVAPGG